MRYVKTAAAASAITACAAVSLGDVAVLSRTSTLASWHHVSYDPPPFRSYSYTLTTSELGPVTLGSGMTTFTSSATAQEISASMHGSYSSGGGSSGGTRTAFSVVFQVTDSAAQLSLLLNGSIWPYSTQNSGTTLRIVNTGTGQTLFSLPGSAPPVVFGFIPEATWTNATWTGTLAPGTYRMEGSCQAGMTYSQGSISGEYGGGHLSFVATIIPAPGAAAVLGLGGLAALRRRR
ncbi:MAG TPA: hypothetical protein VFF65_08820 [Phycisphaerales bacterium]|nr:hypothetical protein [Phycisphaerales bacterium]